MQQPSPVDPACKDLDVYSDIVIDPQPLGLSGPMAQDPDEKRNTRQRLDTF